jgi:hypothetical protein
MSPTVRLPKLGDKVTLACSCRAEVVVPLIVLMPRHSVVKILGRGPECQVGHVPSRRAVVRWTQRSGQRVFVAVSTDR